MTSKADIRAEALRVRDRITPRGDDAENAARHFMESIIPQPGQNIALYWPRGREFDTLPLLHILLQGGFTCALPVMEKGTRLLQFRAYRDGDTLAPGPFGIIQPASGAPVAPDIFVVPLLAFDRSGNRLGHGMGYYDETIKWYKARKPVVSVGYAYGEQAVLFPLPTEPHDQKLDWIITPQKAQRMDK